MNINGIIVNPATDALVESHAGNVINGYSATREIRETPDGRRYCAVTTHPDGRVRVEVEADGVRWIRFPSGVIEGTRLADGAPVEPTRSPASEAAAALGRMGGSSTSPAKRAASRANGAKGGRPTTEFHFGKIFRSEGGFRVCGGVWAGGPIIKKSPWFATREEAERVAAEMIARRAENERLDRLAGLRP